MNTFNPTGLEQHGLRRKGLVVSAHIDRLSSENTDSQQEVDDTEDSCDYDWCDGPTSRTLSCFECFEPAREYETSGSPDAPEYAHKSEANR